MLLTPTEMERLTIYTAAELARRRRAKGLKLNHPEATAIIADEILEGAREGKSVAELIGFGSTILTGDDVMPGVVSLPHGFGHAAAAETLRIAGALPGPNANALTDDQLVEPVIGTSILNGVPVRVESADA